MKERSLYNATVLTLNRLALHNLFLKNRFLKYNHKRFKGVVLQHAILDFFSKNCLFLRYNLLITGDYKVEAHQVLIPTSLVTAMIGFDIDVANRA